MGRLYCLPPGVTRAIPNVRARVWGEVVAISGCQEITDITGAWGLFL
jgi:hypothetical protein